MALFLPDANVLLQALRKDSTEHGPCRQIPTRFKMPTYQFLLHTTGIRLDVGDEGDGPAIGFYTSRRVRAKNSEDAYDAIMAMMDHDPDLTDVFKSGHDAGLRPKTEVEEVYLIPWWRSFLPWRKPGLAFYNADTDDETTS